MYYSIMSEEVDMNVENEEDIVVRKHFNFVIEFKKCILWLYNVQYT